MTTLKDAKTMQEEAMDRQEDGHVAGGTGEVSGRADGYVFISYKSEEKEGADWIRSYVEAHGYRCWMAPDSLHRRGTQDYGKDILQAIRDCRCLLFAMSPKALGSWWVNQEVKTAMAKYHRPIIPFMVEPVPDALKEDSLYAFIENDKQILNAESAGKEKEHWKLDVLLPYLAAAFGVRGETDGAEEGREGTENRGEVPPATHAEWERWRSLASFHLGRLREFKETDLLDISPTALSPEARRRERRESATAAALALMRILGTDAASGADFDAEGMAAEAKRNLAELVYTYGDDFLEEVWNVAEPHAERGVPWATFVMHARHYSPDGRAELKESDEAITRRYLETAVQDTENLFAAIRMGVCWEFGVGGEVSGTRALYWFQTAASAGCQEAWYWLGELYRWGGYGVRPDLAKAREMAERGAESGNAACHALLGDLILYHSDGTDGQSIDYGAAEKEYAAAWRGGCFSVLAGVFGMKYGNEWELRQPEFQNLDLLLERAARAGIGAAWQVFYNRAEYWNWGRKHLPSGEEGDQEPEISDAAIQYALAGTRQNNRYSAICLGEAIILEALDEAGEIDVTPIAELAKEAGTLRADPMCNAYLDVMRRQKFEPMEKFYLFNFPLSRFWKRVFDTGKYPSELADESEYSTYQFLQYLKTVRAEEGGKLDRVRRLWRGFRLLEQGICAKEVGQKKWAEVFPEDSFRFEGTALDEVVRTLQDIPVAFPAGAEQLRGPVDKAVSDLLAKGDRHGSLLDENVQEDFLNILHLLDEYTQKNTPSLRVAKTLASLERRLSPPMLAAPLRLFRNAFLQKHSPVDAVALGVLFFTMNARYREEGKNAGLLFAAREMLWKAIQSLEASAVLPFLELCLFGKNCPGAELPQDFEAIERAEPVIWEIVETAAHGARTTDEKLQCLQISYAMALIFLDEKLRRSHGKKGWGTTSLYDIQKGLEWLAAVLDMQKTKGWEKIGVMVGVHAEQKAKEVAKKGYVIVQTALQDVFLRTRLAKCEGLEREGKWEAEETIEQLARLVDGMALKQGRGFRHVELSPGCGADFVVSDDDLAVVFAVLPEGIDYRPLADGEELPDRRRPKSTHDCISEGNGVSVALIDRLLEFRETLWAMNPSARVALRIYASEATGNSMQEAWEGPMKKANVLMSSKEDIGGLPQAFGGTVGDGIDEEKTALGVVWDAEETIDELANLYVEAGFDSAWGAKHVDIEGNEADFVLSGGGTAVVHAVFPKNVDYRALPAWEEIGGRALPRSTQDCVLEGNFVSEALLTHLVTLRNAMTEKNPELQVLLRIYANESTGMSMKDIWAERLEELSIDVISKADYEAWIARMKEEESGEDGEANEEEEPGSQEADREKEAT